MQADLAFELVYYDADGVSIIVRKDAEPGVAMAEISAILSDLDAEPVSDGALCFCGDTITLPPALIAAQHAGRRDDHRQVLRGA
ncbi:hypothetical protein [Kitasatospora sp. McL0602]|uniref:hypothetical protein n=1 Tax=Kitasatospora sp. McL0602 TaxID=3439530 RepID=UPI003F8A336C